MSQRAPARAAVITYSDTASFVGEARAIFGRAVARGELHPDVDRELDLEMLTATLYRRRIVRARPVTDDHLHAVIALLGPGLRHADTSP